MKTRNVTFASIFLCVGVFALFCSKALFYQYTHVHQIGFTDDAFYYFVVARHIVNDGISSFDGTTLTNGYHPLWMALLVLQFKALSQSLLLTRVIEYLLGAGALVFALLSANLPGRVRNVFFTLGFFAVLAKTSFNGMETTLFAFCFALFTYVSERRSRESVSGGIVDGLLAAAVVFSRIDSVVFILPQILLTGRSRFHKAVTLATTGACGVLYIAANKIYFGTAMPISGEIKALGGLQTNWALIHRLQQPSDMTLWLSVIALMLVAGCVLMLRPPPYGFPAAGSGLSDWIPHLCHPTGIHVFVDHLALVQLSAHHRLYRLRSWAADHGECPGGKTSLARRRWSTLPPPPYSHW